MKRLIVLGMVAILLGLFQTQGMAAPKLVAIANFGSDPALDALIAGFKSEIIKQGFKEGTDVKFEVLHVNFDGALIPQMMTKLLASKPDMLLTVTTPVAQASKKLAKGLPVVFAAVTDPVGANLIPSWTKGSNMMTGASDLQDLDGVMTFMKKLLPNAKTLGVPYNPGEDNDVSMLNFMKEKASRHGLTIVPVGIDNVNDIQVRIQSLKGKADIVYVGGSNLLQPSIPAIAAVTRRLNIPVFNVQDVPVREHQVLAAFSVSYYNVGVNAGKLAAKILNGAKPADLSPIKPAYEDHQTVISGKRAKTLGISVPGNLKKSVVN